MRLRLKPEVVDLIFQIQILLERLNPEVDLKYLFQNHLNLLKFDDHSDEVASNATWAFF